MSVLKTLTEGIVRRDLSKEGAALLEKWEATGLLEGLNSEHAKNGMAVLLENQAKELLREASTMSAGDVEGFASVAFPIVRRVFGGLIANDLVSVQPMSLPSGLIFFMDFVHSDTRAGMTAGESVYGGNIVGKELATKGVDLAPSDHSGPGGFYDLNTGYTSPTGSSKNTNNLVAVVDPTAGSAITETIKKHLRFDPDVLDHLSSNPTHQVEVVRLAAADVATDLPNLNKDALVAITGKRSGMHGDAKLIRRLTRLNSAGDLLLTYLGSANDPLADGALTAGDLTYPLADDFDAVTASPGAVVAVELGLEGAGAVIRSEQVTDDAGGGGNTHTQETRLGLRSGDIPEIDIKVDSIPVSAVTKKLKAKWTPELAQDLNAYHNLDAEVELTGILSEQIALEIDQEILGDLIIGAKAGTRYWSRAPGLFVDSSGAELGATSASPDFTGTVSEWYETLIETINDVSAQIHRKTLRGGANFVVCSPEVANILEFTSGFRASVTADQDRGDIGAVRTGSLSKKFDVMVDPYFPRNVILVGRKGSSFLESGFVYAPYVPLQVTPTIFGTEDFVPRKGVMTRYAKKMVRPDMYGLVIVRGLLGEAGS